MLYADKAVLKSTIKQSAIQLREKELTLFTENFAAIGTQAALLAGFALTALAEFQVPPEGNRLCKAGFYLLVITTFSSALHCVCNTTFISVWGPGLALRGPDNSMNVAIEGMIEERRQVFFAFAMAVLSFLSAAIFMAILVMDFEVALACCGGLCYTIFLIVSYGRRIYKRFLVEDSVSTKFDDLLAFARDT